MSQTRSLTFIALFLPPSRYPNLTHQKLPRLPRTERHYIAMSVQNIRSNGILAAMADELLRLASVVGKLGVEGAIDPDNMFVSIYEVSDSKMQSEDAGLQLMPLNSQSCCDLLFHFATGWFE